MQFYSFMFRTHCTISIRSYTQRYQHAVLISFNMLICVRQFCCRCSKSRGRVSVTGRHRGRRRSPDAEAVLGRTRANQFDRRAQRRRTHSLRRAAGPARPRPGLRSARRWPLHFPTRFLPPPASHQRRHRTGEAARGAAGGRPRGRCPRRRRSLVAAARDTGLPGRAKTTVRARLAAPASPRTANAFIHSVPLPLHARVGRVCRLPPRAELRVWQVASAVLIRRKITRSARAGTGS
jgi:hypothetical protein